MKQHEVYRRCAEKILNTGYTSDCSSLVGCSMCPFYGQEKNPTNEDRIQAWLFVAAITEQDCLNCNQKKCAYGQHMKDCWHCKRNKKGRNACNQFTQEVWG